MSEAHPVCCLKDDSFDLHGNLSKEADGRRESIPHCPPARAALLSSCRQRLAGAFHAASELSSLPGAGLLHRRRARQHYPVQPLRTTLSPAGGQGGTTGPALVGG